MIISKCSFCSGDLVTKITNTSTVYFCEKCDTGFAYTGASPMQIEIKTCINNEYYCITQPLDGEKCVRIWKVINGLYEVIKDFNEYSLGITPNNIREKLKTILIFL